MGDDDAMLAGPLGVDVIVADAEAGDDFQLWQPRHQVRVDRWAECHVATMRADVRRDPRQQPLRGRRFEPEPMQGRARSIRSPITVMPSAGIKTS